MDIGNWIWIGTVLTFCGVPFVVGFCVSSLRKATLLAIASFAGVYASIWSTFGPLFLPLAAQLFTRYEMSGNPPLEFPARSAASRPHCRVGICAEASVWLGN